MKSDPSSNPYSATYWFFDFWSSCSLLQPQFPHPQILIVIPTLLADVKIRRDSFCLSVQQEVVCMLGGQSWLLKHPIAPTSPKVREHRLVFLEQQWHATWPTGTGHGMCALPQAKATLGRHHRSLCCPLMMAEPELLCLPSVFSQFGSMAHMDIMCPAGSRPIGP